MTYIFGTLTAEQIIEQMVAPPTQEMIMLINQYGYYERNWSILDPFRVWYSAVTTREDMNVVVVTRNALSTVKSDYIYDKDKGVYRVV